MNTPEYHAMKLVTAPILPQLPDSEYRALKASIEEFGVLIPILVTHKGVIIDGNERFRVCQELGLKTFPLRVFGKMTEDERVRYSIRVNVERRHLTRPERQRLLLTYISASPELSTRAIADACKVSQRTASNAKRTMVSKNAHLEVPVLGRDGKVYKPRPAASSAETIHGARLVGRLLEDLPPGRIENGVAPRRLRKAVFDAAKEEFGTGTTPTLPADYRLILGDFAVKSKSIPDNSIDLGISDPPWAWDADQLAPFMKTYSRILKQGSLLATYSGVGQIASMVRAADAAGLEYWWQAVCLNPSAQMASRQQGMVRNVYRPVLIFRKPGAATRRANNWLTDVLEVDYDEKKFHEWEQPLQESIDLVRGLGRSGWTVCDLTAGSGTTGCSALEMGCKWIGFEVDETNHRIASRRIRQALKASGETTEPSRTTAPAMV